MISNSEILTELKNHLVSNLGSDIKDIILFGSQATGNSNTYSDYDVLIILNKDYNGNDESLILDLCYDIDLKYNILLDVHLLSNSDITSIRGKQTIFTNAIKSGIYA
jgi:predicted nucleotidyltransferase